MKMLNTIILQDQRSNLKSMRVKVTSFTVILLVSISSLDAQVYYQIQNRWTSEFIHVEQPKPAVGAIQPGWLSAQWVLEPVSDGYYQIKNRWKNEYLHIQNGPIECGAIQPGWWSAQWALEPVAGTSFVRIRSRWKSEVAIHNQQGFLEAGSVDLGWWSAQWQTLKVSEGAPSPSIAVAAITSANVASERNGDNPKAFSPEHNGRIAQVSVRYTDQISISGDINAGTRIYFFPQEVNANTDGINFDPKNPPIGGQTFTVIEVTPQLKLDRPMPMMRNRNNDFFGFVVEIF
jgi:hypothetical protein